ncbi:hypothetical protein AMTR_s00009p00264050 [Amborella trichopoda]|uniref:EF-hand domain-containing protein n=1 Tax=Amborella trichopoda TaxID=13333 RepID=W1NHD3_AMBTC|nr:hypothetical protein AMTR_s00009p00264050 [Amborella trichopoda]
MKPLLAYALLATGLFLFLAFSGKPPATSSHRRLISRRPQEPRPSFFDLEWEESFGRNAHFSGNSQRNSGHSGFSGENSGEVGGNSGEFGANSGEIYDVTRRLVFLFPLIDVKPKDGFVSYEELEGWNVRQAIEKLQRETEREMRDRDKDGDGTVTLREFLSHVSDAELEINNMANGHPGWWREQFRNADEDGNGSLNLTEFNKYGLLSIAKLVLHSIVRNYYASLSRILF